MQPATAKSLSGVEVLVVEDQPDMRFLLKRILTTHGADVRAVGTAGEALSLLEDARPAVIVSDISLPDMDGYEMMRQIREEIERDDAERTPAVALSGHVDSKRSLAEGFQVHLVKPVNTDLLVAVVARLAELDGAAARNGYANVEVPTPADRRTIW